MPHQVNTFWSRGTFLEFAVVATVLFGLTLSTTGTSLADDKDVLSELKLNDGSVLPASLVELTTDGVVVDIGSREREVSNSEMVKWGGFAEHQRGELVALRDGTQLVCRDPLSVTLGIRYANNQFVLRTPVWRPVEVAREQVRMILLRSSPDPLQRDLFVEQLMKTVSDRDTLWLRNRDVLLGRLQGINDDEFRVQIDDQEVSVPIGQVTAVVLGDTLPNGARESARPVAAWGLQDGSILPLVDWSPAPPTWQVTTPGGLVLTANSSDVLVRSLQAWQSHHAKLQYVSDRMPAAYRHVPLLDATLPLGSDRNVLGHPLRKNQKLYRKGLGMPSTSRAAYALDGAFTRFQAELAVDDEAGQGGSVIFRVYLSPDGRQWTMAYESPMVCGTDRPLPISVSLEGSRFLALIVDYADRGDVLDYADWLDARWVRD